MASGSFRSSLNTSAGSGYSRYIEVIWSSSNDTANNKSTITWDAYSRSNDASTSSWVYAKNVYVTIAGTKFAVIGATAQATYKDRRLSGGTVTVDHDSTGRKSVSVSITAQIYYYGTDNSTYSGTITMSPNPVYTLSISAGTGSNITVNRTTCAGSGGTGNLSAGSKKLYYGDKLKITFSPSSNYSINAHTVNSSTFTSGNTHTVSGNVTVSATATPLKSIIGATDANIGSTSTITITRYNSAYRHTITYSFGNLTGTITTKTSNTSIAWTIPTDFYAKIPNAKTGTCTLTCTTYNGDTNLGSSTCTLTVTASSTLCSPSVDGTVIDTNTVTVALTGDSSKLIRYKSTAKCTITASAKNSASISTKYINNGVPTNNVRTFSNVSDTSFVFSATDSRGYSSSKTVKPSMVAYIQLTLNPVISRPTPTGGTINMTFNGNYYRGSFGAFNNTLTIRYRYKTAAESTYSGWTTIDSTKYTIGTSTFQTSVAISLGDDFDYKQTYMFQVNAFDGANGTTLSSVTKTLSVQKGTPVFDWGENDFNFNVPVYMDGIQMDYIVEQGQSGIWFYRKWNSGYVELDGKKAKISFDSLTQSGGIYYGTCGGYTYPFTLKEILSISFGFICETGNVWYWGEGISLTGITSSYCGRGGSRDIIGYPTVRITGKWK